MAWNYKRHIKYFVVPCFLYFTATTFGCNHNYYKHIFCHSTIDRTSKNKKMVCKYFMDISYMDFYCTIIKYRPLDIKLIKNRHFGDIFIVFLFDNKVLIDKFQQLYLKQKQKLM